MDVLPSDYHHDKKVLLPEYREEDFFILDSRKKQVPVLLVRPVLFSINLVFSIQVHFLHPQRLSLPQEAQY